ncbi:leucine-rich repeat-domain-containing protein [Armillaria novae-zelandiae]|uniref:U2 small nuclear ribonucleoprotein A' n=1 Tax=Armillaria novae-zelandiae TaxID=153914 RepID=A0AA39TY52_9AGAR|nr:leucine-rich repeat-domain-containing protein [Armillaria novae-zelandiae]
MKLTPELLAQASSALNPCKERQLDLRGYKIPAIENLGITRDQHDSIDMTDNSVVTLGNFPLLKRLHTLLMSNNRVAAISPSIHLSIPHLTTLVLTNNNVAELGDLEPLKELKNLKYLSLLGNPVREKKWYREWLAWRIPGLRVLDFQRIRDKERKAGKSLFVTAENLPTALATTISSTVSNTQATKAALMMDEPRQAAPTIKAGRLMSKEDAEKVKAAIAKASSIDEIRKLERSLREGYMPEIESVGA